MPEAVTIESMDFLCFCTQKNKRVGRTTFYYMIKDLTSSNHGIVSSVNYVQALLVAEPVDILQQIVGTLVHTTEKEILSQYIAARATFLKLDIRNMCLLQMMILLLTM